MKNYLFILSILFVSNLYSAKTLLLNAALIHNPPNWLNMNYAEKPILKIQSKLEWSVRRVDVFFYNNWSDYLRAHNLGKRAVAVTVTKNNKSSIHMSPNLTKANYPNVMAHELVHVILRQKYKDAIPKWLEEGLANHLAQYEKVDYKWLAQQTPIDDVTKLSHPFQASKSQISYRYKASQALAEMLQKKCDLENLIRLSVERKMTNYIDTFCGIKDINLAFKNWLKNKSKI